MKRSSIIVVGLLVLATIGAARVARGQATAPDPLTVRDVPDDEGLIAKELESAGQQLVRRVPLGILMLNPSTNKTYLIVAMEDGKEDTADLTARTTAIGDAEGALMQYERLLGRTDLSPVEKRWITQRMSALNLASKKADAAQTEQQSATLPGRYQLIGESGWVYRMDTATGEVVGMLVGNQGWVRVGTSVSDKLPATVTVE